jgi:tRNA A-37 threonylcarbamoyl transferase component Bud32
VDDRVVLPVNTVLDNAYRIVRVVGSGGFGITYEAEDIKLNARIAIKEYYPCDFSVRDATMVVRPKSERHKEMFDWGRSNFLLEARTLARFEHPSIVRVSRVFETNSTAYMVMRFEQGRSFEGWLQGLGRPPTQAELDAIVAPLLDALEIMHAQKFLHRDIAPDNIIIRTDNTPVLLDFGAARRAVAQRSRALTGIVKAGYSPQEQYASDGRLQGPWSDLYALGGTLYRAVTGTVPEEATLRVSDDRTPSAASVTKGTYRPSFLAAIDACLKVRYADRPQSVAELRPMMFAASAPPPARSRPDPKAKSRPRSLPPAAPAAIPARAGAGRLLMMLAAFLVLLGGAYGGYERKADEDALAKAQAENRRKAELAAQERQQAEAAAAKKKAEEEAAARRAAELAAEEARRQSDAAARKKAEENEARRKAELAEQEARRQEEIAAAKQKTEEDRRRAEEEAERRKAETAERERRRLEMAKATAAFDGVWEITRKGSSCFTGTPIFGVTIENGMFAQGYGSVSPNGEFKLPGRSKHTGPRDLHYVGMLIGNSGSGTFQADGGCSGTFTARRR